MLALVIASGQYFRAGIIGQGGITAGYESAKGMLTTALLGLLIASSAWLIVTMWTRAVSMLV